MRKVGIITICDLRNYGNRLQAYALSKVIEKLNCKPVAVLYGNGIKAFLKNVIRNNYFLSVCFEFFLEILKGHTLDIAIKKCKRICVFSSFSRKIKSKIFLCDRHTIDHYVCGSDQIWNPVFAGSSNYFAAFAKKEKRISYAASFGISQLPEEVADRYKCYLTDMQYISVREDAGAQIVKELTGKDAQVVIDPTLMLDANEWREVSRKPEFNVPDKYILTYFLGNFSEETYAYIQKLAEENSIEIISLHNNNQNDYWYHTGPSEFIWLIENASLICTDSFHASVFSVLMDSPFIAFRRNYKNNDMNSRFESLLGMCKLTDRFSQNIQKGDEFKKDYRHVPEILNFEREKAIDFLTEALNLNSKRG